MADDDQRYETIRYEVADGIATITLNRPDALNAINATMEREVVNVWDHVDVDDDVRAVVVTGAGRAFCAGYDCQAPVSMSPPVPPRDRAARAERHPARQRS